MVKFMGIIFPNMKLLIIVYRNNNNNNNNDDDDDDDDDFESSNFMEQLKVLLNFWL